MGVTSFSSWVFVGSVLAERCAVRENDRRVLVLAVGLWWPDLGREEKREGIEGSVGVHACYC